MEKFDLEDGFKVQRADLARWKKVLNEDAYKTLEEKCFADNTTICPGDQAGHEVKRGKALLPIVDEIAENVH